jgi:hypothetical protein
MKNLFLRPTEKPSRIVRIYSDADKNNFALKLDSDVNDYFKEYVNIYITSDEKPKVGDWCISTEGIWKNTIALVEEKPITDVWRKIILTTDQDLIKDGVQAIADTFLEWFVKNPSCESIEINEEPIFKSFETRFDSIGYQYKIIIPKEEPTPVWKQIIESCGGEEEFMESAGLKPKQETLEEAAENYCSNSHAINEDRASWQDIEFAFKDGANYQAERMYSEEEAVQLLIKFNQEIREVEDVREWFEQFKKK